MIRLVIFSLFLTFKGFAQDVSSRGIYRATLDACSKIGIEDLSNLKADKLLAGYFPSREFTDLLNYIRRESTTQVVFKMSLAPVSMVEFLVTHPEYKKALSECYPDKPQMIAFFDNSVRRSDKAGKIVGVAALLTVFRGQSALQALVQKWSVVAFSILQTSQKAIFALVGTSLLRSDSETNPEKLHLNDVLESVNSKVAQESKTSKAEMIESIKLQILQEQKKINSCDNCPELTQLTQQKKALESLLSNLSL